MARLNCLAAVVCAATFASAAAVAPAPEPADETGSLCKANDANEFIFKVNFVDSPAVTGLYEVEGCDGIAPTLHFERGVTYTLVQNDRTNWYHPIGLAYYPDGAHGHGANGFGEFASVPELEFPTPDDCDDTDFQCNPGVEKQAPLYCQDGVCETYDDWNNGETSGLDFYEPFFARPIDQWEGHTWSVQITIPLDSLTQEFFYFCHIHSGMSGVIKVADPPMNANQLQFPFLPEEYYPTSTAFEQGCGVAAGTDPFHTNASELCPGMEFLCSEEETPFNECMEAIDCEMNHNMRILEVGNPIAVFMHQMIPHHVNAINMARILQKTLKDETVPGADDEETDLEGLLLAIINEQNQQVQTMQAWLDTHNDEEVEAVSSCPSTRRRSLLGEGLRKALAA
jgi:hypothetical protein